MFRKMRRAGQQLDVEEVRQVLENAPRGVLSVLGDDDYPYGIPMNFVYDPTRGKFGSIYFHSALVGHKIDAMAACDKASFCTLEGSISINTCQLFPLINSLTDCLTTLFFFSSFASCPFPHPDFIHVRTALPFSRILSLEFTAVKCFLQSPLLDTLIKKLFWYNLYGTAPTGSH